MTEEYLWYIPNSVQPGHRGDDTVAGWGSLDYSVGLAELAERHGWGGALIGTGWGRPDTFAVAAAIAARTTTFTPLLAARPGYWSPAQFASATATLDNLTGGRLYINIVSGSDNGPAYGDGVTDKDSRYARTAEFLAVVRRLWSGETVTHRGEFYRLDDSALELLPRGHERRAHPRLYFGGASDAAQRVAAAHADVQLFWGEPLDGVAERVDRLKQLQNDVGREHPPLEFGLRITTLVRDTTEQAWHDAEAKLKSFAGSPDDLRQRNPKAAVGQQRLLDLVDRGEVLDSCLYTTPGRYGGGGAGTTWLVGSAADVTAALARYAELGITHFVLSDTPYRTEVARVGDELLPRLRRRLSVSAEGANLSGRRESR